MLPYTIYVFRKFPQKKKKEKEWIFLTVLETSQAIVAVWFVEKTTYMVTDL